MKNIVSMALVAILIISCKKNDPLVQTNEISFALPISPQKAINTTGDWLAYELHLNSPIEAKITKIEVWNQDKLLLTNTDITPIPVRLGSHLASIWVAYPPNGWDTDSLIHKIYYSMPAGKRITIRSLKIEKNYPDPLEVNFPIPSGIWLAEGAPGISSYHTRAQFLFKELQYDDLQQSYLIGANPQRFAIDFNNFQDGLPYKNMGENIEDWYCYNQPILAALGGEVIFTANDIPDNKTIGKVDYDTDENNATGNVVYVKHDNGTIAVYAHLIPGSVLVNKGDRVVKGQTLARLGNSGNSFAPHLHFHVMANPTGKELVNYSDGLFLEGIPYIFPEFEKLGSVPVKYLELKPIPLFNASIDEIFKQKTPTENDVIKIK